MAVVTSLQKDKKILNYLTLPGPLCAIMLFLYGYWYKKTKAGLDSQGLPGLWHHLSHYVL